MTQEKLGEVLGISGQAVSKWESGATLQDGAQVYSIISDKDVEKAL